MFTHLFKCPSMKSWALYLGDDRFDGALSDLCITAGLDPLRIVPAASDLTGHVSIFTPTLGARLDSSRRAEPWSVIHVPPRLANANVYEARGDCLYDLLP